MCSIAAPWLSMSIWFIYWVQAEGVYQIPKTTLTLQHVSERLRPILEAAAYFWSVVLNTNISATATCDITVVSNSLTSIKSSNLDEGPGRALRPSGVLGLTLDNGCSAIFW